MADQQITIAGLEDVEAMLAKLPDNAKFGASVGLNRTADEVQADIRQGLGERFTLRRKTFVERTIYRKPGEDFATKTNLLARVRVHDERDFLAKHEQGGHKTARDGGFIAVPVGARPSPDKVVPQRYTLKALFFGRQGLISQAKTIANTRQKGRRKTLLKRSVANDVAVIDGKVYQRVGKGARFKLKLLWVFKKATPIPPRLKFWERGRTTAEKRLRPNVEGAIAVELERGLTSKSGPVSK